MDLEVGYYKVESRGMAHNRRIELMRVFIHEGKKYFQLSDDRPIAIEKFNPGVILILSDMNPFVIHNASIEIVFADVHGDMHRFKAKSVYDVRKIFKQFPALARALKSPFKY